MYNAAVQPVHAITFRRNLSPHLFKIENQPGFWQVAGQNSEDGDGMFHGNVGSFTEYTESYPEDGNLVP
jgi:hypothetical protein